MCLRKNWRRKEKPISSNDIEDILKKHSINTYKKSGYAEMLIDLPTNRLKEIIRLYLLASTRILI